MKNTFIVLFTFLFLLIEIAATYIVSSIWIILALLLVMGVGIVLGYKQLALASVISLFLYGGALALMQKSFYVTKDIKIVRDKVFDKKGKKVFRLEFAFEHIKKSNAPKEVVCEYYTLFGKKVADYFCYLKVGSELYELQEVK